MLCNDEHNDEHDNDQQDDDDDEEGEDLPWLANAQEGEIGSDEREARTPGRRRQR